MSLTLIIQDSGSLPSGRSSIEMVGGTLTIGRSDENDLALPDPERTLSKRHCVLEERNGDYVVVDISTNGTFLNYGTERLDDIPTPLNHGDVILVGSFELVVEISGSAANPGAAAPLPPADESMALPNNVNGAQSDQDTRGALDDLASTGADFLDDLLGGPADLNSAQATPAWTGAAIPDDPLAPSDPFPAEAPKGLPDGTSAPDHSPASQDHFSAPRPNAPMIPDDWDDPLGPQDPPVAPAPTGSQDNPFGAAPASPIPPQSVPAKAPTPASPDATARAFFDAAGVAHLDIPAAEVDETMARMGRVVGAMIAGMREILMTRASIKSELRMNRTMINAGGNNPLKFSINAEQAVETMIRPSVRGYLDAEAAIIEALNDIKAHEVAMMSGMEAALKDLLARLDPEQLSARIETGSPLGSKKARYWEAYEKMYAQISKETEDDFQSAFGREFARAYEEQLKKL